MTILCSANQITVPNNAELCFVISCLEYLHSFTDRSALLDLSMEVAQDWALILALPEGDNLTLWKEVGLSNRPNMSNKSKYATASLAT